MKYCDKCGNKLDDAALFCDACGAKQEKRENPSEGQVKRPEASGTEIKRHREVPVRGRKKKTLNLVPILIGVVVVIAAFVAAMVIKSNTGYTTIDLADYVTVSFEGLDTEGTVTVEVDPYLGEDLRDAYDDYCDSKSSSAVEKILEDLERTAEKQGLSLRNVFDYKLDIDKERNLSNGDEVKVTVSMEEDYWKKFKVKIKPYEETLTVEGLKEIVELTEEEIFAGLKVTVSGVSPFLRLGVENGSHEEWIDEMYFKIVSGEKDVYMIGDTVEIGLQVNSYTLDNARKEGVVIDPDLTTTYTIENADRYVESWDEITEDVQQKIIDAALACAEKKMSAPGLFAAGWPFYDGSVYGAVSAEECPGIAPDRVYTLLSKEAYPGGNVLYLILSGDCTSTADETWNKVCYFPVQVNNVILREDGLCEVNTAEIIASDSGDTDPDNLYQKYVSNNKDRYTVTEKSLKAE